MITMMMMTMMMMTTMMMTTTMMISDVKMVRLQRLHELLQSQPELHNMQCFNDNNDDDDGDI